jgi:hypothetical protein
MSGVRQTATESKADQEEMEIWAIAQGSQNNKQIN